MPNGAIFITPEDMTRLRRLVDGLYRSPDKMAVAIALEEELDRAEVVPAGSIPPDVVTLGSEVKLKDLDSGKTLVYRIVYPNTSYSGTADAVSVLAPLGTALLGYRAGDVIESPVPRGIRRLQVLEVLYQPEAASASVAS